jgi:hypothetical protein
LLLDGRVDRTFHVAGDFLHSVAGLAALLGHADSEILGLARNDPQPYRQCWRTGRLLLP